MNNENNYITRMSKELWDLSNKIYKAEKKARGCRRHETRSQGVIGNAG